MGEKRRNKRFPSWTGGETLDEVFSDTPFYQFHHEKIENFIRNADRYYRLHIRSNLRTGSHVSKTQLRAI